MGSTFRRLSRPCHPKGVAAWLLGVVATVAVATPVASAAPPPPPAGGGPAAPPPPAVAPTAVPDEPAVPSDPPLAQDVRPLQVVPESVPVATPVSGLFRNMCGIRGRDQCLSPFLRDSDLRLHLRTFWFDRHNPDESRNEAWALGGWLAYTSGLVADVFSVGAVGYTSQPLYAPEEYDGTSLLAPGQEEITVLGQAWARLQYCDYAVLTGYRQSVNDGYVGPQDNRMIPNAFEGVTLRGKVDTIAYSSGYLWDMKPRNSDEFIPMSEQAGVKGSDDGLWFGSLTWTPCKAWEVFAGDYYTPDVFNTAFGIVKHKRELSGCVEGQFGVQYTDQRSVGDEGLGSFETWNAGVGARFVWKTGWTIGAAFHATGDGANIRSPYGTWPGWLSLIETDFDRANEKAAGVSVKYDFGKSRRLYAPGLTALASYGRGIERENPSTGASLPDTGEVDFDVIYDVPTVKGLQLRLRNAYVDAGGPDTGYQFRFIVNWEIDLW